MLYYLFLIYYKLKYGRMDEDAIIDASKNGDVKFLEWFKNSGYEFKYNEDAINRAFNHGHVQVLKWFKNSGYKFKYSEYAINWASYSGHIQVLGWFKNYCNIKKIIKNSKFIFIKTIKFKTKHNYIKGYNKN